VVPEAGDARQGDGMIDVETARQLLDFSARLPNDNSGRGEQQLVGAVALHNILKTHGVAYLADEVGLGKTYVALGVVALLRHFDPALRVLVIAPRENIQRKWMKETRNFIRHNVRHADLRVRELDGSPSRPLVMCGNLAELVREASLDPRRDFFARMTSFSIGLTGDAREASREAKEALRGQVQEAIPWIEDSALDLRLGKAGFKDAVAQAICCALPAFDLVIVDEGHNLKHGFSENVSARNRVMGLVFGHPSIRPDKSLFPGYGPKAKQVLFLSATPVEESYRHLWNQLDVFGKGDAFALLADKEAGEAKKREEARKFLIRRVTEIHVGGERHTKNLYRREWRFGGVDRHDVPIQVSDLKGRLVVALVQKKVMELLGSEKFGASFQIGMLASFESFLETSGLKEKVRTEGDEGEPQVVVFDDAGQTDDPLEREGLDVQALNKLAKDYRSQFDAELPHPKMDALVKTLAERWTSGRKALVFVRRIGSVKELKAKLDAEYDRWLHEILRRRLPLETVAALDRWWERYRDDEADTFFSWFFRGDPKKGVFSGALLQQSFTRPGSANATFFEVNDVGRLLAVPSGRVLERLAEVVGLEVSEARARVNALGKDRLRGKAQRLFRFEAAQVGGLRLLAENAGGDLAREAKILLAEKYPAPRGSGRIREGADFAERLEEKTFFSELVLREALRDDLWPEPAPGMDLRDRVREREQRAQLLATAARLGHSLIDLYVLAVKRRGNLKPGRADEDADEQLETGAVATPEPDEASADAEEATLISDFLDLLEGQRRSPLEDRWFGAYDELSAIGRNFPLIVDVNLPNVAELPLAATGARFGTLLGEQQPVAGMSGQVNMTLVQQFRMPGYPFVLVSTDLLQEGEDLHTFCSDVFHYGISWTPSAMEQRIGRVDRVRSLTERRLREADRKPEGLEKLQVYYPYLSDTVEVLQVVRVLKRMDTFLRLMHEDLALPEFDQKRLSVSHEIMGLPIPPVPISTPLESAFPVKKEVHLNGKGKKLVVDADTEKKVLKRLEGMCAGPLDGLPVEWQVNAPRGQRIGVARLDGRRTQPFVLEIQGRDDGFLLRCSSHVGQLPYKADQKRLLGAVAEGGGRVHVLPVGKRAEWLVSVAEDVLLAGPEHDDARAAWLVKRVVNRADELEQQLFSPDVDAGVEKLLDARRDLDRARHEGDARG
jgi:Helicase conserved C-terminal domain./SNF2 family N-terminal domain.